MAKLTKEEKLNKRRLKNLGKREKVVVNPNEVNYFTLLNGTVIDTTPSNLPTTLLYKQGDKVIILPAWDGRWLEKEERLRFHHLGTIGEIVKLDSPSILIAESEKINGVFIYPPRIHYESLTIKTKDREFTCHPDYYRLGFKVVKLKEVKQK